MRKLVVVSAGLSTPSTTRRLADAVANTTAAGITARGEHAETTVIELRELAQELACAMTDWSADTPALKKAQAEVLSADGLIAVTPAFQGSYSGLFKMFFDTLKPTALKGVPTLIAATGGSTRHAMMLDYAMRPLFNYLHAVVVPTGIFFVAQDCDGTQDRTLSDTRIRSAAAQLADAMVRPNDRVAGLTGMYDVHASSHVTEEGHFTPLGEMLNTSDPRA